jgi:hypothetical protein
LLLGVLSSISFCATPISDGTLTEPQGGGDPPWGKILFVNGVRTDDQAALGAALAIAKQLNRGVDEDSWGVRLLYNDLRIDGGRAFDQAMALVIEKLGDADTSVNPATAECIAQIRSCCESDRDIWLIGHSAGTLCIQNAVRKVAAIWRQDPRRTEYLSHIRLLYLGGAVFRETHSLADGTPEQVTKFEIHDLEDGIAQYVGAGEWGTPRIEAHWLVENYGKWIDRKRFAQGGELVIHGDRVIRELVAEAKDPADRVLKLRIEDLRSSEESRRTRGDFALPWRCKQVRWVVSQHPNAADIRFTVMEDIQFLSDEPKSDELKGDAVTDRFAGNNLYIGRVGISGRKDEEGALWITTPNGFFIEARPTAETTKRK